MKCRKPFRPKTRKITPAKYRATVDAVFIRVLLFDRRRCIDVTYLGVNTIDDVYFWEIQVFMNRSRQGPEHVWLVMMKAMRALTRYAAAGIEETGLGLSDFGVLEILHHKGPCPSIR